ncbi:MAG: SDR family NAD(P)-dependent oxidoreductase [Actinocrinis sp.]
MASNSALFDLGGRTALVTGAARGLGRAIALELARAGADLALGLRDASSPDADTLAGEIEALGRRALRLQMDVADLDQVATATDEATERFGAIDILVNNAGFGVVDQAEDVTLADFERVMDVNVRGTFFTCQSVGRLMLERGYGRIVNLSSQAGVVALPTESVYCMTKAAIIQLTKCLAVEWGARGVTVNAVAPTFIETPGTAAALGDPHFRADVVERIAGLHRIGRPREVASAVLYLVSPAASLVTGHTLVIDGGWTAR